MTMSSKIGSVSCRSISTVRSIPTFLVRNISAQPRVQQQRYCNRNFPSWRRPRGRVRYMTSSSAMIANSDSTSQSINNERQQRPSFTIYYNDVYEVILPPNHRFPMEKYGKVRRRIQNKIDALSPQEKNRISCEFRVSPLSRVEELSTTHSPVYVARFLNGDLTKEEIRNVGFPWSKSGVDRALSSVGGTVQAACDVCDELVRRTGHNISHDEGEMPPIWAAHVAGGTHHAFFDYGEGFCVFSDIAVAANVVLQRYPSVVKRILIIDLDVHQGNGNAVLFQGRDDVRTFSMHCSGNYFSERQTSDLDVELPMGCTDETYLATLYHWINQMRKNDDIAKGVDLIFFQAGVDILHDDRLGRMSITSNGVERRNKLVFDFAHSLQIPMVITMGGGYPRANNWDPILEAHANVYFQAHQYLSNLSEINISSKEDRSELISDNK
eukprot:CAMPEP_0198282878 /NCGR_PEP_ID=MMETSP1449-20131203/2605_1 /TAXON_ID=420275 /ORGANISM="Attheya septentrionalis, Strain CCMP2084" /LENGTH=438 /DNA_ID=CAMNT_0043979295 /DNA_START=236 /DNA_END=1552 /DNA_ORIENTATION=+